LTENVVQATARDMMATAMMALEIKGYPVILSVHDEIICEVPDNFGSLDEMIDIMTRAPAWAKGCPINAEGKEEGEEVSQMTAHAKFGASNAKTPHRAAPAHSTPRLHSLTRVHLTPNLVRRQHEFGEFCLVNGHEDAFAFIRRRHNGHKVDDNMARAVQVYIDHIRATAALEPSLCRYEKRFSLDKLDPPMPMFGTADCIIYGKEERHALRP